MQSVEIAFLSSSSFLGEGGGGVGGREEKIPEMLSETVRHLSFKMLNQADYILILYLNHHNTLLPNIGKGQTARVPEIMQPVDCILSTQSRGGGAKTVQGAGAKHLKLFVYPFLTKFLATPLIKKIRKKCLMIGKEDFYYKNLPICNHANL